MKVLVTGKGGQLGYELAKTLPNNVSAAFFDSCALDITKACLTQKVVEDEKPNIIINAAAYTAVDRAETDVEAAYAVNEVGVKNLALAAKSVNAKVIHISTDFIFDGSKASPYATSDRYNPLSVYGASKLAGEIALQSYLPNDYAILRTAWVYSSHGNNFVKTMLRLMNEKEELSVVSDQLGSPTWANGLAKVVWHIAANNDFIDGTEYHWTDAGQVSWYDFALVIQSMALKLGILHRKIPIKPIATEHYPTPARRPSYSVLDKKTTEYMLGIRTRDWQEQLEEMLKQLSA